jgi:hypothetical protein
MFIFRDFNMQNNDDQLPLLLKDIAYNSLISNMISNEKEIRNIAIYQLVELAIANTEHTGRYLLQINYFLISKLSDNNREIKIAAILFFGELAEVLLKSGLQDLKEIIAKSIVIFQLITSTDEVINALVG